MASLPLTKAFAKNHLPDSLFNFCVEKRLMFDIPNQRGAGIEIPLQQTLGKVAKATRSILSFLPNQETDAIHLSIQHLDINGARLLEIRTLFKNKIWKADVIFDEQGVDYIIDDLPFVSFIDHCHEGICPEEKVKLKKQIEEDPATVPGAEKHYRSISEHLTEMTIKTIRSAYFEET